MKMVFAVFAVLYMLVSVTEAVNTCASGLQKVDRYHVTSQGLPGDIYIAATSSSSSVTEFYDYSGGSLTYSGTNWIIQNTSTIGIHRDSNTEKHSLILLNGPPLEVGDAFVRASVEVSKLPVSAQVAVVDDPKTDTFEISPEDGTLVVNWRWKNPNSDGIAITIPQNSFCVDVRVLSTTHPSKWIFYSGQRILQGVEANFAEDSIVSICHESICTTPTPTPRPEPSRCPENQKDLPRYRVWDSAMNELYFKPYVSNTDVTSFYGYNNGMTTSLQAEFDMNNYTLLMVHDDTTTDMQSLVVAVGSPTVGDGSDYVDDFVYWTMEIAGLPTNAQLVVQDDPESSGDSYVVEQPGNFLASWKNAAQEIDGIAIALATRAFCARITVKTASRPTAWRFADGEQLLLSESMDNTEGSDIFLCYDPVCVDIPILTPTPSPSPVAAPIYTPCPDTSYTAYRVRVNGFDDVQVAPVQTETTVEELYSYGKVNEYAAASIYDTANQSVVFVHEDTVNNQFSFVIINGRQQSSKGGDGYVNLGVRIRQLPVGYTLAVTDDPTTDKFDQSESTVDIAWSWKSPNSDGVAIRMPGLEFCIAVDVVFTDNPSSWVIASASHGGVSSTVYPIEVGRTMSVCYMPSCQSPSPTPSPDPNSTPTALSTSPPSASDTPAPTVAFSPSVPSISCPDPLPRWRISAAGEQNAYITPYNTDVPSRVFYGYTKGELPDVDSLLNAENSSLIMVHHDTVKGFWNLMIYLGTPLQPNGLPREEFSMYRMRMLNAPPNSGIPVKDDDNSKYDVMRKTTDTELFFKWRVMKGVDGVMVNMFTANFCVMLMVDENTFVNNWKFASGANLDHLPISYSNEAGKHLEICYNPYCANTVAPTAVTTATATTSSSASPSATLGATSTPSADQSVTETPTASYTQMSTPSVASTASSTPASPATPTESATAAPIWSTASTPTASATATPISSATSAPTASATAMPTESATSKPTASATSMPTASATSMPTTSATSMPTASATSMLTASATSMPTASATSMPTASATSMPTVSPTSTPAASPTSTPIASATSTPTASATPTPTVSATSTPTASATSTPTASPTSSAAETLPPFSSPPSLSPSPTLIPSYEPCDGRDVDICFAMDLSSSMDASEVQGERDFVATLIHQLEFTGGTARYSGVHFGSVATEYFQLTEDAQAAQDFARNLPSSSGSTNLHSGIDACTEVLKLGSGARQFIVLVTDGYHNEGDHPLYAAEIAKALGIDIVTVGAGGEVRPAELDRIASTGYSYEPLSIYAADGANLRSALYPVRQSICSGMPFPIKPDDIPCNVLGIDRTQRSITYIQGSVMGFVESTTTESLPQGWTMDVELINLRDIDFETMVVTGANLLSCNIEDLYCTYSNSTAAVAGDTIKFDIRFNLNTNEYDEYYEVFIKPLALKSTQPCDV